MSNFLRLSWHCARVFAAHYRHAPLQAGGILLGVVLAVTLLVGVRATNDNAIRSYSESTELLSQRATGLLLAQQGDLDETWYFKLRQSQLQTPLAVVTGVLENSQGQRWEMHGSDLVAAMSQRQVSDTNKNSDGKQAQAPVNFNQLPLNRLLSGEPLLLMSQSLAKRAAPNGTLQLKQHDIRVLSVNDDLGLGNNIVADISFAQTLLGKTGRLSYIALFDPHPQLETLLQQALGEGYDQHLRLIKQDQGEALTALTQSFHLNLNAMSLLAFIVGLFIAYNGVRYSLLKRQTLLVKLLQQGVTRQALMAGLLTELLALVILGSCVGFVTGLQLSQWLQPLVALTLEQLYGAQLLPGQFQWRWLFQAIVLTLVAAGLACIPLYLQLSRQPLARSATRVALQSSAERQNRRLFILATVLLGCAAILLPFSNHYKQSLLLMGLVIVAIPMLLPLALQYSCQLLAKWSQTIRLSIEQRNLLHYSIAETRELIAPLSLAMMAMLLALCANIAMNTLVSSFDITLRQWLDNRLHADVYFRPALSDFPKLKQDFERHPQVNGIFEQWNARISFRDQPTNITTQDEYSLRNTTVLKEHLDDFWPAYLAGESILISEPLAIKQGINMGDKVAWDDVTGRWYQDLKPQMSKHIANGQNNTPRPLTVAGVFFDYGNPLGEIMIAEPLWHQLGHQAYLKSIAITTTADFTPLVEAVQAQYNLSSANVYSQGKIKDQAMKMFAKTFSITSVLNSLTLLVAAIGLFSAVVMLTQSRQAPLARLYALGVTRRQIRISVFGQMLLIIGLSAFVAIPTGYALSYLLIHKVTLQAFGWSIPMVWSWMECMKLMLIALATGTIAVSLPLYWQTRRPLVASLQQEAM
ncbi:ABC transporter permease [Shewanella gelidii]|uniref:ABC3 transporter permease C-terminal domain-containing protein n=1 Tax=Shewanella gelidii TaxID=1642821 RepID=A0A917N8X0_9GAMM|nr:FtsX-like permease family protein [Shewanella gelidii]MCL1097870.1 FtsX-like permease family protein [Shewanella gelidii]GGI78065.1 hypothetical protein GCM10009332_14360 [Shewanella gelidii]